MVWWCDGLITFAELIKKVSVCPTVEDKIGQQTKTTKKKKEIKEILIS